MATKTKQTNYQDDFQLRDDLVQRDVYAYETALRAFDQTAPTAGNIITQVFEVLRQSGFTVMNNIDAAHYLKAAIVAHWITAPEAEVLKVEGKKETRYMLAGANIDDLHPGMVRWYGSRISAKHTELITPPDPN